jgi:hypothetical protein
MRLTLVAMLVFLSLGALPPSTADAQSLQYATYVVSQTDNPPPKDPTIVANQDYFSLYVDGICINRDEDFWKKNVISVSVAVEVNGKPLTMPVYADRAQKTACRIAVSNFGLLNSIPARGLELKLGASVLRFDNKDTIKQMLSAITSSTNEPILKIYASTSIPYISLVGTISNILYRAVGPSPNGEELFSFKGTTLEPDAQPGDPFQLRDMLLLEYFGTETLDKTELAEKDGDVLYKDKPLRSGAWITLRIEKHSTRRDWHGREWYNKFNSALQELEKRTPSIDAVNKAVDEGTDLLFADDDFTPSDQKAILKEIIKNIDDAEALHKLGQGYQVAQAIENAKEKPVRLDKVDGTSVTPVSSPGITEAPNTSGGGGGPITHYEWIIDPEKLTDSLGKIGVSPRR